MSGSGLLAFTAGANSGCFKGIKSKKEDRIKQSGEVLGGGLGVGLGQCDVTSEEPGQNLAKAPYQKAPREPGSCNNWLCVAVDKQQLLSFSKLQENTSFLQESLNICSHRF